MPHKRAKRSVREKERSQKGTDLAPRESLNALASESIPKSMARVLNAARVRQGFRKRKTDGQDEEGAKKRRRTGDNQDDSNRKAGRKGDQIKILPGESLNHFNRRVEDDMRPLLASAFQTASSTERKARKEIVKVKSTKSNRVPASNGPSDPDEETASPQPKPTAPDSSDHRPKEFKKLTTSAPRRLNDIALAPPTFSKLPRQRSKPDDASAATKKKSEGVLSMAQKKMMEEERERVVARYREMKEQKLREGGRLWKEKGSGDGEGH